MLATSCVKEINLIVEKKQQIKIVCYGIALTCILYVFFVFYVTFQFNYIICEFKPGPLETSVYLNLLMGIIFIVEITPCLYIPYVFYYIPVKKGVVGEKVESNLIQDIRIEDANISL
jgi:hypothetical protein